MKKLPDHLTPTERKHIEEQLDHAYDFDPRDPLFGLTKDQLSGNQLSRRTMLRLFAAAGTLSAWHLLPNVGMREAKATPSGELVCGWGGVGEIRTLDPARMNQVEQFQIGSNLLSGLMHVDSQLTARGDIAESWTISDDGKMYVFKLREGVTFHNGDKLTSVDVVYTYNRSRDPDKSFHYRVLNNVADVSAVNDLEVKITLGKPQASFLGKTLERSAGRAMTIVNRRAIEELGDAQYGLTPVGTGPFRCTSHVLGQGVVIEKFEDYYDPERPKLDKVTFKPIPDPEPLAAAIEAGDIQLIGGGTQIAPELVDRFEDNPDITVDSTPGPGFMSLWMNPWNHPFQVTDFNKPVSELMKEKGFKVRLAIAKALDRERLLEQARFGRGIPAYGSINPALGYFFDEMLEETSTQRFDAVAAQTLLAEAGFPNGKGFPRLTLKAIVAARREAQVIADILKRNLNIDIDIQTMDVSVLLDEFLSMKYDLMRLGSGGDFDPDDALVDWMQTESKFNARKRDKAKFPFGYFSEKEADELITAQQFEIDLTKRKETVQRANRITSEKVACAFLYHPVDVMAYRNNVHYPRESRIPGLVDLDRTTIS